MDGRPQILLAVVDVKISVIVPFGADDSPAGQQRAKVFRWVQSRWNALQDKGLIDEVIIGIDPLFGRCTEHLEWCHAGSDLLPECPHRRPFSVSRALNDAAKHARGDVFLLFGADHVPDPAVVTWAVGMLATHPWVRLHDVVLYADEKLTASILADPFGNSELYTHHSGWTRHSAPCPGVLALTRASFESARGLDERFQGWGYEDTEFLSRLAHLVPAGHMTPSGLPLRELYVPSSRNLRGNNLTLFSQITTERGW